jgi:hypothetical protein
MLEFTTSVVSFSLKLGHSVTLKFLYVELGGQGPQLSSLRSPTCPSKLLSVVGTQKTNSPLRSEIASYPAGCLYLFFLPHVSRCHQGWWRSMAFPLIGPLASCRQSLPFLPATVVCVLRTQKTNPPQRRVYSGVVDVSSWSIMFQSWCLA